MRSALIWLFLGGWALAVAMQPAEPWPFTTFPMFKESRAKRPTVRRLEIVGVDESGATIRAVRPAGWSKQALEALSTHPGAREGLLRHIGEGWNAKRPAELPKLREIYAEETVWRMTASPEPIQTRTVAWVTL